VSRARCGEQLDHTLKLDVAVLVGVGPGRGVRDRRVKRVDRDLAVRVVGRSLDVDGAPALRQHHADGVGRQLKQMGR
jgi:hypothetical protein